MSDTLQRALWDGHPVSLGTGFELHKPKGERELHAVCSLHTHRLGWELVLEVNGLLSRSQVCRSRDEVLDLCERWRAVMDGGVLAQPGLKLRSAGREVSNEGLEVMPCHCRDYRDDGPGDHRMG